MSFNFADMWEAVAARRPDAPAQIHGPTVSTFGDFDDRAARLAAALHAWGVGPGSKVALFLFNCNEYLESVFAAMKVRAVPVNVNYRYLADELHYLLENSDAEVLVYHGALAARVEEVRGRLPNLRILVQVETAPEDRVPLLAGALSYEDVVRSYDPMAPIERSPSDHVFLYTGGTTGLPKGVMWTHRALFAQLSASYLPLGGPPPATLDEVAAAPERLDAVGAGGAGLAAAPLMHGMAWFSSMGRLMIGGAVVSLTKRSFDAHEFWRAVAEHRIAAATIVGDAFARPLVAALEEAERRGEPYDVSSLQMIVSGGVMWTPPFKQPFLDRGVAMLIDGLGSSEATGAGMMISMAGQDLGTARFQLGTDARVITEDGRDVAPGSGEVGMIAVSGDALPDGYYKDESKSAATFRTIGGRRFAIPGDFATVEADGTITLLGRGSVCINSGGEKIFPEEVEEALKTHPTVEDCTVVGVPDDKWGQAITAVAQCVPNASVTPEELIEHARGRLAAYKAPKHVVFVDRIVRSPAGKADYRWALDRAKAALGIEA